MNSQKKLIFFLNLVTENLKILNSCHYGGKKKKNICFVFCPFSKKKLASKVWALWTHDQQF